MRLRRVVLLLCFCVTFLCARGIRAEETPAEHAAAVAAQQEMDAAPVHGNLPDYSLSPDKLDKAQHMSKVRVVLHIAELVWGLAQFALLLWGGVVAWMRDRAMDAGRNLRSNNHRYSAFWLECTVFAVLYNLLSAILDLPLSIYSHVLSVNNGLSVQGWHSWFGDWGKGVGLSLLGGLLGFALLMGVIRKFPRSWWLVFWAVLAPIIILAIYATPIYIDPIFNKFEPLQKTNPDLVTQLEKVVERGHMNIPPDRMFLMRASAKTTTMNAYVTGFGASKRVVVWDTSLTKGTPDEVLFIFGHESGHYVLGHVLRGIAMTFFGLFVLLFLGYKFVNWSLRRFGPEWRVQQQSDWGAIPVLFFSLAIFSIFVQPVFNSVSRHQEHAADVYGQEAVHGIVADPQKSATSAFSVLGEAGLDEPNTPPWVELWMDNHPATGRRAAFAAHYDPWAPGLEPKYFKKDSK